MRWDALFEDMEAQLAAEERLGFEAEVAERARTEAAGVGLSERLRGSLGMRLAVHLASGGSFEGTLAHAGAEALVLNDHLNQVLIPYAGVVRYTGLGRLAVAETSRVRQKLGLASALRGLARDRSGLTVFLAAGSAGQHRINGVIDRVGRDYLDLALTDPGEARRSANVREVSTVPFAALAALRSHRGEL
jgi:hypothetical protein